MMRREKMTLIKGRVKKLMSVKKALLAASLFTLFTLSGCTHLRSQFQCPLLETPHCKSLEQINRMVDRGELGQARFIHSHGIY